MRSLLILFTPKKFINMYDTKDNRIFSGFISLWITDLECKKTKEAATYLM